MGHIIYLWYYVSPKQKSRTRGNGRCMKKFIVAQDVLQYLRHHTHTGTHANARTHACIVDECTAVGGKQIKISITCRTNTHTHTHRYTHRHRHRHPPTHACMHAKCERISASMSLVLPRIPQPKNSLETGVLSMLDGVPSIVITTAV